MDVRGENDKPEAEENTAQETVVRLTPMMEQYIEIKAANVDSLLFYRMGDFYELFFDDAVEASAALGITLTKRGKHLGEDIPMCGVPVHAADDYLQRLIAKGYRVAVCEQVEDPAEAKKRGSKSVVRRDVIRLVTPGTLTEEKLLDPSEANFLMALGRTKGDGARAHSALPKRQKNGFLPISCVLIRASWWWPIRRFTIPNCARLSI
jgi:DNA mismatch repair protein MutS